jgi:hypothetical protein
VPVGRKGFEMRWLTAIAIAFAAAAPALADCTRSQLGAMCEWEEQSAIRALERSETEAQLRARLWQWLGPRAPKVRGPIHPRLTLAEHPDELGKGKSH